MESKTKPKRMYAATPGGRLSDKDAAIIGPRLDALGVGAAGFTPAAVVDDARPPASPLHPYFEWDDSVAAEEYRGEQAQGLIRHVRIVIEEANGEERLMPICISIETDDGRTYQPLARVLSDAEMRQQMLDRAEADLAAWRDRYAGLKELAAVHAVIARALRNRARRQS